MIALRFYQTTSGSPFVAVGRLERFGVVTAGRGSVVARRVLTDVVGEHGGDIVVEDG